MPRGLPPRPITVRSLVRLKGGGPLMVVHVLIHKRAHCLWLADGRTHARWFPLVALELERD